MADFWSGFNQGFQPYGTRAADLISRTILNNAQYDREVKDKQKIEQEKIFRESLLNQQYDQIENEVKNGDFTNFTKLPSDRRVAINQYIDHTEPKKLYQREDVPGKGRVWHEVTVPKDGEPTFRELSVTPTELRKDVENIGGKRVTKVTFTDGKELITETKPENKGDEVHLSRRELYNNAQTDKEKSSVREFIEGYKKDILTLGGLKKGLAMLNEEGYEGTTSYINQNTKYEILKAKTTGALVDLFEDREMAKIYESLADDPNKNKQHVWDGAVEDTLEEYLKGGLTKQEEKTIELINLLYMAQYGQPQKSLRQYIK